MSINPMNSIITFDEQNVYLTNFQGENLYIDLIAFPVAPWANKTVLSEMVKNIGISNDWY